jgi:hypothetical protein
MANWMLSNCRYTSIHKIINGYTSEAECLVHVTDPNHHSVCAIRVATHLFDALAQGEFFR